MKTPIDQAVDRFLCWKLPEGFCPDNGITFKRESDYEHPEFGRTKYEPTGTNLFDAQQAKAMLEHVCEPLLTALQERDAEIERLTSVAIEHRKARLDNAEEAGELRTQVAAQRRVLEQALDAIIDEIEAIDCRHRGDPSYEHCPYTIRDRAAAIVKTHQTAITAIQEQLKS